MFSLYILLLRIVGFGLRLFLLFRLDDAFFNGVEFFGFDKARLLDCFLFLFCESFVLDDVFDGGFFFAALFDYDFSGAILMPTRSPLSQSSSVSAKKI